MCYIIIDKGPSQIKQIIDKPYWGNGSLLMNCAEMRKTSNLIDFYWLYNFLKTCTFEIKVKTKNATSYENQDSIIRSLVLEEIMDNRGYDNEEKGSITLQSIKPIHENNAVLA